MLPGVRLGLVNGCVGSLARAQLEFRVRVIVPGDATPVSRNSPDPLKLCPSPRVS